MAALQSTGHSHHREPAFVQRRQEGVRRFSGIRLVRVPINTWAIDDAKVLRALVAIREAEKHGPVLIHCMHGADRTGVVAAVYRMAVQDWDKDSARHEMLRGGYGYHTLWRNIPRYIERLDPRQDAPCAGPCAGDSGGVLKAPAASAPRSYTGRPVATWPSANDLSQGLLPWHCNSAPSFAPAANSNSRCTTTRRPSRRRMKW
jgi:protein tyrosine phosphatase (PTP) superfamily phosphohydrolase (DUF442 family)